MYRLIRPILFRIDAEHAHNMTDSLMQAAGALPPARGLLKLLYGVPRKPVLLFGLEFPNPVGLAAGSDKDGRAWRGFACLGFGHIEVGTVTPRPQAGNPKPRVFRLPEQRALVNWMGFPGQGADYVARRLRGARPGGVVLGANLGKNKDTPLDQAAEDYTNLIQVFAPRADYLAINVSSPNTEGLRKLQGRDALEGLLTRVNSARREQERRLNKRVPVLVKLSPDLDDQELDDALEVVLRLGMDGVIATNTTVSREGIQGPLAWKLGGLSGAPLRGRSTQMVAEIVRRTQGRLPVIGAGGVMDVVSAQEKLDAGASLVQVFTGLVYQGPSLVKQIVRGIRT